MNKFIQELVEKTFDNTTEELSTSWELVYLSELKSYWLKENNWFFPQEMFEDFIDSEKQLPVELELANLFQIHHSSSFFIKKNEGENTLVLYIQKNSSDKLAA